VILLQGSARLLPESLSLSVLPPPGFLGWDVYEKMLYRLLMVDRRNGPKYRLKTPSELTISCDSDGYWLMRWGC
jgi:hypothetical protein